MAAQLKGLKKLATALQRLKDVVEETRESLDEKKDWWDNKTEKWQQGDNGQEWEEHLGNIETLLDDIDALDVPYDIDSLTE